MKTKQQQRRRRRRRNNNKSVKESWERYYRNDYRKRYINSILQSDDFQKERSNYHERVIKEEREQWEKSIIVKCVKDLNQINH